MPSILNVGSPDVRYERRADEWSHPLWSDGWSMD